MSDTDTSARWQIPEWYRRLGVASWYFIGVAVALGMLAALFSATTAIVAPVVLGTVLAVVFAPAVDRLEARSIPRGIAAGAVLTSLIVLTAGVISWMAYAVWGQSEEIAEVVDDAADELRRVTSSLSADPEIVERFREIVGDAGPVIGGGIASAAVSFVDAAVGVVTGSLLGAIVLYYLLKDGSRIVASWVARSPEDDDMRGRLAERITLDVRRYFRGRTVLAAMNGVTIGLGALVLGVPAASAIAVVNFFGGYIPYLGALIGGAFAVLMALGDGGIAPALTILVLSVVVNIGLENLMEPKLLGATLELHPLLVLLATALGGLAAGMIGLILAAPSVAVALSVTRELSAAGFFDRGPSAEPDTGAEDSDPRPG